ncbi:MAG: hypothetical protein KC983_07990, partial [Phycisphaerales bacterium]|nr:hypothetical protein [Phycisphaerales bacterium]
QHRMLDKTFQRHALEKNYFFLPAGFLVPVVLGAAAAGFLELFAIDWRSLGWPRERGGVPSY